MGVILMEILGIDIAILILTVAFFVFWITVLAAFVVLSDKNPYFPRKYYDVTLENKEGKKLRVVKGWIVTTNKVKYFRIGLRDFPQFKGIEKDISMMECKGENGEIVFIEDIPDKYQENNYMPKYVPITQKERFISEITQNINEEGRAAFEVKVREAINKNSRLFDLNTSQSSKEYISQARREAERVKGDDFITKYGPTMILLMACLFAYLILDGSVKAYQKVMESQNSVMSNGYAQIVSQCGGTFVPINPNNVTDSERKSGILPFN
jgi:hypothetical protein